MEVLEKVKTHILCSVTFFRKSCRLWYNVEKCEWATEATHDNIIRRRKNEIWVPDNQDNNTGTLSRYLMVTVFFLINNGYANAPQR
jgi:hypothetical protein